MFSKQERTYFESILGTLPKNALQFPDFYLYLKDIVA
jgi:hypothetical protein